MSLEALQDSASSIIGTALPQYPLFEEKKIDNLQALTDVLNDPAQGLFIEVFSPMSGEPIDSDPRRPAMCEVTIPIDVWENPQVTRATGGTQWAAWRVVEQIIGSVHGKLTGVLTSRLPYAYFRFKDFTAVPDGEGRNHYVILFVAGAQLTAGN